jgi:hypothetical protein
MGMSPARWNGIIHNALNSTTVVQYKLIFHKIAEKEEVHH